MKHFIYIFDDQKVVERLTSFCKDKEETYNFHHIYCSNRINFCKTKEHIYDFENIYE